MQHNRPGRTEMLKVYGVAASRAFRPLWLLEELGLSYHQQPIDFRDQSCESPEYLAINLYLASKYGRDQGLWPDTVAGGCIGGRSGW